MSKDADQDADGAELRRRAEDRLRKQTAGASGPLSQADTQRLIHELQVHQIELELQNEELRDSRAEVETLLARYTDLYDFAPTGYFTLTRAGVILAVNLTGARLVGIERHHLLNRRLPEFVTEADRPLLSTVLEKLFSGTDAAAFCEVTLPRKAMRPLVVRVEGMPTLDGQECHAAVLDVTQRHEIETERNRLIKELQDAAASVKVLRGLLPICSYCKKIRDDKGYWEQLEGYITNHSEALFSHGICPKCYVKAYAEFRNMGPDEQAPTV